MGRREPGGDRALALHKELRNAICAAHFPAARVDEIRVTMRYVSEGCCLRTREGDWVLGAPGEISGEESESRPGERETEGGEAVIIYSAYGRASSKRAQKGQFSDVARRRGAYYAISREAPFR